MIFKSVKGSGEGSRGRLPSWRGRCVAPRPPLAGAAASPCPMLLASSPPSTFPGNEGASSLAGGFCCCSTGPAGSVLLCSAVTPLLMSLPDPLCGGPLPSGFCHSQRGLGCAEAACGTRVTFNPDGHLRGACHQGGEVTCGTFAPCGWLSKCLATRGTRPGALCPAAECPTHPLTLGAGLA